MRRLFQLLCLSSIFCLAFLFNPAERSFAIGSWLDMRMASPSSPSITSWDALRRDIFVRGFDGALWWKFWDGELWSEWKSLGGLLTSAPDCVSPAEGSIYCVARGIFNWLMMIQGSASGGVNQMFWTEWKFIGGDLASGPAMAALVFPDNVIEFRSFARDNNDSLMGIRNNSILWGDWFKLANSAFEGDPDCFYKGSGEVDCVLRTAKNTLLHNIGCCLNPDGTAFEDLGGALMSDPTIASPREELLYVLARGAGDTLWLITRSEQTWSSWREADTDIALSSAPDCVSVAVGEADCVILGPLSRVFYKKIMLGLF